MKKHLVLLLIILAIPHRASAYAEADQQVMLDFPVINTVETSIVNTTASINSDTGALSNNLQVYFDISTNHDNGSIAEFSAQSDASEGSVNAMAGSFPFSNRGKIALANIDSLPSMQDIDNALNFMANPENNKNVITYEIVFYSEDFFLRNPIFNYINDATAKGNVIQSPGKTRVRVSINNNSLYLGSTFNKNYDYAGTYQATIYCTVYSP